MNKVRHDRRFDCACIQFDVRRGDVAHNLAQVEQGLRSAGAAGARFAVLPEMWTTSFLDEIHDDDLDRSLAAERRIVELSGELEMVIVGGGPVRDGAEVFNRALVAEEGEVRGEYRKIHLFSPNAEHRHHQPGSEPLIVDTSIGRIGVVICYDIRFPELIRYYFCRGVEILAVPAQWPEARANHWRVMLKCRAIENQMFVVGCNRTGVEDSLKNDEHLLFPGDSRVVDPMGDMLAAGSGEETPLLASINPRRVQIMHRILPVGKDRRPEVYSRLWIDFRQTP